MILRSVDVETTGLDPAQGARVCEIGWTDVVDLPKDKTGDVAQWAISAPRATLVNPGCPIPPEISAIHHIVDADVIGAPKFTEAFQPLMDGAPDVVFCAHVAKFEQLFITVPVGWICTYKVALSLAPHAPSHSLQALRYWLKLDLDRKTADPPHRAGPDSYVCAHLIARLIKKLTIEQMIEITARPAFLPKFTFGAHAMKPIADVPESYLEWIVSPKGITDNEDVRHTAFTELARRRSA